LQTWAIARLSWVDFGFSISVGIDKKEFARLAGSNEATNSASPPAFVTSSTTFLGNFTGSM
jgi:hypothetical protein